MKYYIWLNGSERGPLTEEELSYRVRNGTVPAETPLRQEDGEAWDRIVADVVALPPPPEYKPLAPSVQPQATSYRPPRLIPPFEMLQRVRGNSCYSMYRSFAAGWCFLSACGTVFATIMAVIASGLPDATMIGLGFALVVLNVGFWCAVSQCLSMFADIADVLLANHRE